MKRMPIFLANTRARTRSSRFTLWVLAIAERLDILWSLPATSFVELARLTWQQPHTHRALQPPSELGARLSWPLTRGGEEPLHSIAISKERHSRVVTGSAHPYPLFSAMGNSASERAARTQPSTTHGYTKTSLPCGILPGRYHKAKDSALTYFVVCSDAGINACICQRLRSYALDLCKQFSCQRKCYGHIGR
ncbi:hypothetical protein HDE77_001358 [Rhodanobacter sp. MP7CTX1]|nr:hypothetical protein [Rhodanobacter sp. MP7CTX1]